MSDLPKIIVPRPGELREAVMRWLVEVDDHLTTEEPDNALTVRNGVVSAKRDRPFKRVIEAPGAEAVLTADERHAQIMAEMRQVVKESVRPQRINVLSTVGIAVGAVFLVSVTTVMVVASLIVMV